jgi:methylase of polypeptide subunit release factors
MSSTPPSPTVSTIRFGDLDIAYDDRVLTPRPWTAAQSRWAAELLTTIPPGPVLELCSGAGHIGLLAIAATDHRLVAVDADPVACEFARRNAAAAGLAGRVEIRNAPLTDALEPHERFALVVADPPWVPTARTSDFPADPLLAIDGGTDGLALARQCVAVADRHLDVGGVMLLQLGSTTQAEALDRELPDGLVLEEVRRPDPTGVVVAVRRVSERTRRGTGRGTSPSATRGRRARGAGRPASPTRRSSG